MLWNTPVSRQASLPKHFFTVLVTCLAFTLTLCTISHAIEATDLQIVTEHLPPYNYKEGDAIKGVAAEVVQALLKELGLKTDIDVLSWVRAYQKALKEPNVLIFSIVRTPERETLFHWVGEVSTLKSYLFKLTAREDIQIATLGDAKDYRIGTWREDVREQYLISQGFAREKQLDSSGSPKQNIQKLMKQRIDLVADSDLSFYYLSKQLKYDPKLFTKAFKLEEVSRPFYIAFSKTTNPDLIAAFSNALERLKRKGIFNDIHQKYLGLAKQVPGGKP